MSTLSLTYSDNLERISKLKNPINLGSHLLAQTADGMLTSAMAVYDEINDQSVQDTLDDLATNEGKVQDVQVNGSSVLENGIAKITIADSDLSEYLTRTDAESTYQVKGDYATKSDVESATVTITTDDLDLSEYLTRTDAESTYQKKSSALTTEDLDTITTEGMYWSEITNTCTNKPEDISEFGLKVVKLSSGKTQQICFTDSDIWMRTSGASGFASWVKLVKDSALANYVLSSSLSKVATSGSYKDLTDASELLTKTDASTTYAAKSHTHTMAEVTDLPGNIATETFVTNKIAEAQLGGSDAPDLSGYATKDDLTKYQTKLTFDTTPTADSSNPVTSDGIKTAIDSLDVYETMTQEEINNICK